MNFTCPCGCGLNSPSSDLISRLERAEYIAGFKFHYNSGCRCEKHNSDVGGSTTSSHLPKTSTLGKCTAVDIAIKNSRTRFQILEGLIRSGFHRIGIDKTYIHADVDHTKDKEVAWMY